MGWGVRECLPNGYRRNLTTGYPESIDTSLERIDERSRMVSELGSELLAALGEGERDRSGRWWPSD